jgi:hypothetical protein
LSLACVSLSFSLSLSLSLSLGVTHAFSPHTLRKITVINFILFYSVEQLQLSQTCCTSSPYLISIKVLISSTTWYIVWVVPNSKWVRPPIPDYTIFCPFTCTRGDSQTGGKRKPQTAALERIRSMFAHSEPLAIQTLTRQVPGCIRSQAPLLTRPWLATLMASGSPGFQGNRAGLYQRWTDTQSHRWQYHHGSATRYYWMIDGPMRYLGMSGYLSNG